MFRRILAAIDGSEYTGLVLPAAIEVGRKFQAQIFVLHVSEHDRGRNVAFSSETPAGATKLVADAVREVREAGVAVEGMVHDVAVGHVAKDIVETAAAKECDLVVMGSRGLSDVEGLLLGSVTHKVIHLAPIMVLVARGPIPVKAEQPARLAPAVAPA